MDPEQVCDTLINCRVRVPKTVQLLADICNTSPNEAYGAGESYYYCLWCIAIANKPFNFNRLQCAIQWYSAQSCLWSW